MRKNLFHKIKDHFGILTLLICILLIFSTYQFYSKYNISSDKIIDNSINENIVINNKIKFEKESESKNSGVIWTTRDDCGDIKQNVNQFCIGEIVWIEQPVWNVDVYVDPFGHYGIRRALKPSGLRCEKAFFIRLGGVYP